MKEIIISLLFMFSGYAKAHPVDEPRVTIEQEGSGHYQAGDIQFSFQLFDTIAKKPISESDLNESHTKKLHFIAYDAALKEFNHVHPSFDGKTWHVTLNLPVDGQYFFWAQGELTDKTEFSTSISAMVMGGRTENGVTPIGDVRVGVDQNTKVELDSSVIKAGKMTMLNYTVSRTDGLETVITPYLGAFAHVISTPSDGDELMHVHPMQGNKPNTGMLHATFASEGDYRIWIQLIDRGELKTVPLSVTVTK